MKILTGHTSPETAYTVADYPYGFRLRCKIRYWLEHKKSQGFRLVSQTTNPKREGEVWNKPKRSTYAPLGVMFLDEQDHVQWTSPSIYDLDGLDEFYQKFEDALGDEPHQYELRYLRAIQRARAILKERRVENAGA